MRISRSRSLYDNRPVVLDGTWEELVAMLRACPEVACTAADCVSLQPGPAKCKHRDVGMWSPSVFDMQPDPPKPGEDPDDCGWKSLGHVVAMDVLTYDVDHVTKAQLAAVAQAIEAAGLACIIYSTHSNDPEHNDFSVRIVIPLSRPIPVSRGNRHHDDRVRAFRKLWEEKLAIPADRSTKDETRMYFMPSRPKGTKYLFAVTQGTVLEVGDLEAVATRGAPDSGEAGSGHVGSVPAPAPVLDIDLGQLREQIKRIGGPNKPAIQRMLKGEPLVADDSGKRDITLNGVMSACAMALPYGTPADGILEVVRHSLGHWTARDDRDGRSWLGQAEHQLLRALNRRAEEEEQKAAERARNEQLRLELGLPPPAERKTRPGEKTPELKPELMAAAGEAKSDGKYSKEELAAFCKKAGVDTVEAFRTRWVIRNNGANWLWVDGRYQRPIKDVDLQFALIRDLSKSPIVLFEEDKKTGETFPRKAADILTYYSSVANGGVQGSLSERESWYDPVAKVFHEAICPLRPLTPLFDAEIDHWLRLFGNELVLDWVAACSMLERQCAAMYLKGEGGIGKTLLASGLARLWHEGGATVFTDAVGANFNGALTNCPLIFADESIPKTPTIIDDLRRLIGQNEFSLNRKFMPTVNVTGAVRLLIAGNNEHILNTPARLESSDVDAMAQRILFVDMTDNFKPKAFLDSLKAQHGDGHISRWLSDSLIARHSLWLRENRKLDLTARFIVTGAKGFADRLATTSGNVPVVFEFLARYLSDDAPTKQPSKLIKVGQGRLLVSTELLAAKLQFERYVPARRVLTAEQVAQALKQVRSGVEEGEDGKLFHIIKAGLFLDWCVDKQVGNIPAIKKAIGVA